MRGNKVRLRLPLPDFWKVKNVKKSLYDHLIATIESTSGSPQKRGKSTDEGRKKNGGSRERSRPWKNNLADREMNPRGTQRSYQEKA